MKKRKKMMYLTSKNAGVCLFLYLALNEDALLINLSRHLNRI